MHQYRGISVQAIDSGKVPPHANMTIWAGPDIQRACSAYKSFGLDDLSEIRDIIDWAGEAYGAAFDELTGEGWTVQHHDDCEDGESCCGVEA